MNRLLPFLHSQFNISVDQQDNLVNKASLLFELLLLLVGELAILVPSCLQKCGNLECRPTEATSGLGARHDSDENICSSRCVDDRFFYVRADHDGRLI